MVSSVVKYCAAALCLLSYTTSSTPSLLSSVSQSSQISNEYSGDGDSYWVSTSRFDPMKDAVYGSLTLKTSMYMKFDLTWHGLTREAANRDYEGILRVGNPSSTVRDCSGHATRYPALYLDRSRKALQFALSNDIDCWGVGLLNVTLPDLHMDSVYTVIMQYNQTWVYIQVNGYVLFDGKRLGSTPDDMLYSEVSVMVSDGLDPPADVTLGNMLILSYDDELTMYPTPGPTMAPSKQPTYTPTPAPTRKPTPTPTTTTLHPTPAPTLPVDFYATQIKIYAEYKVPSQSQSKMNLVDEQDIETLVLSIFPPWNITMNSVNIDNHHDSINLNMIVSVQPDELVILQSFLEEEMSPKLEKGVEDAYPWMNITDIHYNQMINPIRLESQMVEQGGLIPWLDIENQSALWMILAGAIVCLCSTVLSVCVCYYVCKLRRKSKLKRGRVVFQEDRQMSNLSGDSGSSATASKSGDGYKDDPDTTGLHYNLNARTIARPQREEVQLMMTDGTYVRRKKGKKHPIQYERIESNAEHLDDDAEEIAYGDDRAPAQFMTPWGPMDLDESADGLDGNETGMQGMGGGWEFEYDFNIDTFPFHLLPTLANMNEEEMVDGNDTRPVSRQNTGRYSERGHRKVSSTLDVLVEDHQAIAAQSDVSTPKLKAHRGMGKKRKRKPHRRTTTIETLDCGVEDSVIESVVSDQLTECNLDDGSAYGVYAASDEGYGRRDTMPDMDTPSQVFTEDPSDVYLNGPDESRLSPSL